MKTDFDLYPEKVMEKVPFIMEERMPASMMAVTAICAAMSLGAGYLLITRGRTKSAEDSVK